MGLRESGDTNEKKLVYWENSSKHSNDNIRRKMIIFSAKGARERIYNLKQKHKFSIIFIGSLCIYHTQ